MKHTKRESEVLVVTMLGGYYSNMSGFNAKDAMLSNTMIQQQQHQGDGEHPPPHKNNVNRTLKFILIAFSFFTWCLGCLFVAIGGYVTSQTMGYENFSKLALVPGGVISMSGVVIFIFSTFGVLGSIRENINFLNVYKFFLIGTLFFEVFCGFIGFAFWPEVKKAVDKTISSAIINYHRDPILKDVIDRIQRELECCGSLTIDDWNSNEYFTCRNIESYMSCGVPWSCCHHKFYRNRQCGFGIRGLNHINRKLSEEIFTDGCKDKAFEFFKKNMKLIGGLAVASTLPIIIGIFMIRVFLKQIMRNVKEYEKDDVSF